MTCATAAVSFLPYARAGIRSARARCSSARARRRPSSAPPGSFAAASTSAESFRLADVAARRRRSSPVTRHRAHRPSQGASDGAFQPVAPVMASPVRPSVWKVTLALYGALSSSSSLSACAASLPSTSGGMRRLSLNAVNGRSTLPASFIAGKPSTPVTASVGFQVRLISACTGSVVVGKVAPPSAPQAHGSASRLRRRVSAP